MSQSLVQTAHVPMPLQIVIDDVGWWSGEDGHERGEPFRTGIQRNHCPADYRAIARLGRALGMRPQAATILCEWDRTNLLRRVPTSTWMGAGWDNTRWVGPWLEEAAGIISQQREHLELVLHGLGHEYWEGGSFTRAEWYDGRGVMRPREQVQAHLEAYAEILRQNQLGEFPRSFVPAAFRYCYGDGEHGLAALLRDWGIRFVSTPFAGARFRVSPPTSLMGLDQGVVTVDRGQEPRIPWHRIDAQPAPVPGPILGLHWPNILHPDPARNEEVVDRWAAALRRLGELPERLLAPDTETFAQQLALHLATSVRVDQGHTVHAEIGPLTQLLPHSDGNLNLVMKLQAAAPVDIAASGCTVAQAAPRPHDGQTAVTLRVPRSRRGFRLDCWPAGSKPP